MNSWSALRSFASTLTSSLSHRHRAGAVRDLRLIGGQREGQGISASAGRDRYGRVCTRRSADSIHCLGQPDHVPDTCVLRQPEDLIPVPQPSPIWNTLQSPAGYCTALLTATEAISNQNLCQGSFANIAYMTTITFTTPAAGPFYVRAAGGGCYGGVVMIDGTVLQQRWSNMWWGSSWSSPATYLTGSLTEDTSLLPAGAHQLTVLAFEDCCDGNGEIDYSVDGTTWSAFSSSDGLPSPDTPTFGTVAVGSTGSPIPIDFYFSSSATGVRASVLTQGVTGLTSPMRVPATARRTEQATAIPRATSAQWT